MKRKNISAVLLTQNNETTISVILEQLELITDEIIIVDGGSVDNTLKIAESRLKTKIFHRTFDGDFATQRNFGLEKAQCKWILAIDTDELFCSRAQFLIPWLVKIPLTNWFSFPRVWLVATEGELKYISKKPYYPDRQLRLFRNKRQFRYQNNGHKTHETFPKKGRGIGFKLSLAQIIHFDFLIRDRKSREKKVARYISLDPSKSNIHKRYLWEDNNVTLRSYSKKLPGDLR